MLETDAAERPRLTPGLVPLMTVACGLSVANLYYCQPLLAEMRQTLGASVHAIGVVPLLTQVGYALGMLFFIPLGDLTERRRLIVMLLGAVAVALGATGLAGGVGWLGAASLAVGITTVVPQLLVPFAAQLAEPQERGRVVGGVMSGLLIGILCARTVSGYVGAWLGWRAMYWIAAAAMIGLALLLRVALPASRPRGDMTYAEGMRSLLPLWREEPTLREAALTGAMFFAAFSAFWTTLVFLLAGPPYAYANPSRAAGLFGLVGVIGAGAAAAAGRLADRIPPRMLIGAAIAVNLVAFALLWAFGGHLWGLVLGVIALDFGTQGAQVSNQTRIYRIREDAHSRLNTVFMVCYFLGGALGSYLGALGWSHAGWAGVCAAAAGLLAVGAVVHGRGRREDRG